MTPALQEALVRAYMGQAIEASVHSGDPGDSGDNEIPGTARAQLTWTLVWDESGPGAVSDDFSFAVGDNISISHIGFWDGIGVFQDSLPVDIFFDTAGTYTLSVVHRESSSAAS